MSTPLHVLFVAVPKAAAEALLNELRGGDYILHATTLADTQQLAITLGGDFQILIADTLEQHSSQIADIAALLRDRQLDIPLLAYSTSNEHLAAAMRAGAQDFISSGNPARILPAVQRELRNVRLRADQREQSVAEALLQEIDGLILHAWDVVPLVTQICQRVVELFDFKLAWIGGKQPDGSVSVLAAAGEVDYLHDIEVRWDDTPQGRGTTGRAISQGRPVALSVDDVDFAPWHCSAKRHGMRSVVALPMMARGEVIGALMLYSTRHHAFDEAAIKRLSAFANRVAVTLLLTQEQQQLRLLNVAMSSAMNAMFITQRDGKIVWFNDALCQFSGYASDEILNRNPRLFGSGEHAPLFWQTMWQTILAGKPWRDDVVNRRKDGSLFSVAQNVTPLYDHTGSPTHFLAVQQDVSEKRELARRVEFLAYHDMLTGLPNRALFNDRMQQAINQAKRDKSEFALLFIDLDGFKEVNDTHGHAAGDKLLQIVANRLSDSVREGDTVARLGGDEFTILLRDVADDEGFERVTAKILERLAQTYDLGGYGAAVTASIGISLYPQHASEAEKLMIYADDAMYQAKQAGRNNFQLFSPKSAQA